jgi:hypothetical protein
MVQTAYRNGRETDTETDETDSVPHRSKTINPPGLGVPLASPTGLFYTKWLQNVRLYIGCATCLSSSAMQDLPHISSDFRISFVPDGPVIRIVTGPIPGSAVNSNRRNGQHSRSAMMSSAAIAIHFLSPGTRNR